MRALGNLAGIESSLGMGWFSELQLISIEVLNRKTQKGHFGILGQELSFDSTVR